MYVFICVKKLVPIKTIIRTPFIDSERYMCGGSWMKLTLFTSKIMRGWLIIIRRRCVDVKLHVGWQDWQIVSGGFFHDGYPGNRNVRYASHNMAYAQGAKIDMSISPSKRLSTKWFKYTQFNVAILIAMRRPNKSHLVEMRCYWWLKNRPVDRNVRSVHAAVNRNVKYREPQRI